MHTQHSILAGVVVAGRGVGEVEGMNREQREQLDSMLLELLVQHDKWKSVSRQDDHVTIAASETFESRSRAFEAILDFVESLGEPIAAIPGDPDPRAGLRRCEARILLGVMTSERTPVCGYFHHWTDHGEAVVELANGKCLTVYAEHYRFTDIPESEKE